MGLHRTSVSEPYEVSAAPKWATRKRRKGDREFKRTFFSRTPAEPAEPAEPAKPAEPAEQRFFKPNSRLVLTPFEVVAKPYLRVMG